MQTERVTFLTTPDHKAALDAFAASNGMSVGHVVREATTRYVVEGDMSEDDRFKLLVHELDEALPAMHAAPDQAIEGQRLAGRQRCQVARSRLVRSGDGRMSMIGDAMRTIESVILLRSKVERLNEELAATIARVRRVVDSIVHINGRLIRLEAFEEVRSGVRPLPRIE